MNVRLHDTHFHLDLFKDPAAVLAAIEKAQVYTIAVTNVPEVYYNTQRLVSDSKYVRAAIGLHPELAFKHQRQMPLFLDILPKTRYVGEVGLDNFNKSQEDFAGQKRIFEQIVLACSTQPGKILTVHSRRAEKEVLDIFGEGFPGKVILHWFSGPQKELQRALSKGFYISVNYKMINSENGKKIISATPTNRLLLETDGPFIEVGDKPCTPNITSQIAEGIFSIKSSLGEILPQTLFHDNLKHLLG